MNIGSIHHKISNTGTANSRAATQIAPSRGPAEKIVSPNRVDSLPASFQSSAELDSEQQLQPIDRIPAIRSPLDSQRQQTSNYASENERAIAFYMITETISSTASQGELIGVDTYA